jgi:high-affinity iron transporter
MGSAFLITLREGIEAALIISILLAYLRQVGEAGQARLVWIGSAAAIVVSLAAGAVLYGIGAEFEGTAEQAFEGLVTLFAVAVLTWMIFWMRRQGGRVKSELQQRVDAALLGGGLALGSLAFVAVLREGIETALFLYGTEQAAGQGLLPTVLGGLIGLSVAAVLGYLLYRGGLRLNLRVFFRVTGVLIIIVAAGLFAFSVHELQEAGWLPFLTQPAYDISHRLSDENGAGAMLRAVIGYNDDPSVLEVIAWASYLLVAGLLFLRPMSITPAPVAQASNDPERSTSVATR